MAPVTRSMASAAFEDALREMVSAEIASETATERARRRSSPTSLLVARMASAVTTISPSAAEPSSVTLISVVCPATRVTPVTVFAL